MYPSQSFVFLRISYWAVFMAGLSNVFSPPNLVHFTRSEVGVRSMHVQLRVEPEVHTQLYRIATLTSLELSSSQAPPFLVHWLEIQLSSPCSVTLFLWLHLLPVPWYLEYCFIFPPVCLLSFYFCISSRSYLIHFLQGLLTVVAGRHGGGVHLTHLCKNRNPLKAVKQSNGM